MMHFSKKSEPRSRDREWFDEFNQLIESLQISKKARAEIEILEIHFIRKHVSECRALQASVEPHSTIVFIFVSRFLFSFSLLLCFLLLCGVPKSLCKLIRIEADEIFYTAGPVEKGSQALRCALTMQGR